MRVQSVNYTDINTLELKIDCLFLYLAIIYSHKNVVKIMKKTKDGFKYLLLTVQFNGGSSTHFGILIIIL